MRELAIFSGDERKQRSSISTDDQLTEEQARLSRLGAFLFDRHHRFHLYVKYLVFWARNAKNNRLLFPPVCSRKGKRSIILKEAASVCVGPPAELILSCHKVGTWRGVCLEGEGGEDRLWSDTPLIGLSAVWCCTRPRAPLSLYLPVNCEWRWDISHLGPCWTISLAQSCIAISASKLSVTSWTTSWTIEALTNAVHFPLCFRFQMIVVSTRLTTI